MYLLICQCGFLWAEPRKHRHLEICLRCRFLVKISKGRIERVGRNDDVSFFFLTIEYFIYLFGLVISVKKLLNADDFSMYNGTLAVLVMRPYAREVLLATSSCLRSRPKGVTNTLPVVSSVSRW